MTCGSAGFEFHNKLPYLSNVTKYYEKFEVEHLKEMFLRSKTVVQKQFFKFIDKESHLLKVSEG